MAKSFVLVAAITVEVVIAGPGGVVCAPIIALVSTAVFVAEAADVLILLPNVRRRGGVRRRCGAGDRPKPSAATAVAEMVLVIFLSLLVVTDSRVLV